MGRAITFGSLFAGIGGLDLGFERLGMECKWQVEIEPYAIKVLEKHWPNVHREKDINECSKENLERVDVIAGGFPCQDISYAGRGAGLDGERSGLFFEAIRLVRELQPRAIVLENVAGLLTRGMDRVLGTLAEVGYDAEWHCIPAAAVGAPHIRDRVFILGYANSHSQSNEPFNDETQGVPGMDPNAQESCHNGPENVIQARTEKQIEPRGMGFEKDVPNTYCKRLEGRQEARNTEGSRPEAIELLTRYRESHGGRNWAVEPDVGRVAYGVPNRMDRLKGLGNAIVPQVAEVVGMIVLANYFKEHAK